MAKNTKQARQLLNCLKQAKAHVPIEFDSAEISLLRDAVSRYIACDLVGLTCQYCGGTLVREDNHVECDVCGRRFG